MKINPFAWFTRTAQKQQQPERLRSRAKAVQLVASLLAVFGMAAGGYCQVYTLSTPISGHLTMSIWDTNGPTGSGGGFSFDFTNLTEILYFDPVAVTLRQVGVISGVPSAPNISFQETQTIPGQAPNPPTQVSGSVTATLTPTAGVLSFDTGVSSLTWSSEAGGYVCDASLTGFTNLAGTYSLTTGGNTYSGSFSYALSATAINTALFSANTFNTLITTGYPTSLGLSGLAGAYFGYALFLASPGIVADVIATNGFHAGLSVGAYTWGGIFTSFPLTEQFVWTSPGTITATLVPTTNPPAITAQPQSQVVNAYATTSFSVTAAGSLPLSYQWSLNGSNISGATLSSLTIPNVTPTNLGTYSVVVTNGVSSVTSSNAVLSMYPFIEAPFLGAITYWGQTNTLSIGAWGTGPLYYQWFQNGVAIQDATNQYLALTSIQATNAGQYSVVVSSALGSVTNTPEQVVVEAAGVSLGFSPTITINGVVNYPYIIQSTTNLTDTNAWVTLTNLTLTQPVQIYVDTTVDAASPFYSRYYYRVLPGQ